MSPTPTPITALKALKRYMIWAPDYTDPLALTRRFAVRAQHLQDTHESWKKGEMELGGGVLHDESDSYIVGSGPPPLMGSMLVVNFANIEEARGRVERDPYWVGNVWDKEKIVIRPILLFDGPNYKA